MFANGLNILLLWTSDEKIPWKKIRRLSSKGISPDLGVCKVLQAE